MFKKSLVSSKTRISENFHPICVYGASLGEDKRVPCSDISQQSWPGEQTDRPGWLWPGLPSVWMAGPIPTLHPRVALNSEEPHKVCSLLQNGFTLQVIKANVSCPTVVPIPSGRFNGFTPYLVQNIDSAK